MLYKSHLATIKSDWKKIKRTFLSPWGCSDFDPLTYMIDYLWTVKMIASLMKAHFGILSVDVPELTTKLMWSDIVEDNNRFGHEHEARRKESSSAVLTVWSLLFFPMLKAFFLPRESLHLRTENYACAVYLLQWFNNKQKDRRSDNMVIFREKNNV